jgi:ubiquitin C-terminal hydrolase
MPNKPPKNIRWSGTNKDKEASKAHLEQQSLIVLDSGPPCPCFTQVSTEAVRRLLDEHVERYKENKRLWLCSCIACATGADGIPSTASTTKKQCASKSDDGLSKKKLSKGGKEDQPPPGEFTCMSCLQTFCKRHMGDHFYDSKRFAERKGVKGSGGRGGFVRYEHSIFFCVRESVAASRRFVFFCQSCDFHLENVMAVNEYDRDDEVDEEVDGYPVFNGRVMGIELADVAERIGQLMVNAHEGTFPRTRGSNEDDDEDVDGGKKRKKKSSRRRLHGDEDSAARKELKQLRYQIQRANGIVGISNFGNTCFFNATVQCLLRLKGFTRGMTVGLSEADVAGPITATVKGLVTMSLPESFDRAIVGGTDAAARNLLKQLGRRNSMYDMGEQHDAHELLLDVLNGMGDETDAQLSAAGGSRSGNNAAPALTACRSVLRCTIECHECHYVTCTDEVSFCLEVALPQEGDLVLEQLLRDSCRPSLLTGDNAFVCGRCCGDAFAGQARRAEMERANRLRAAVEAAAGQDLEQLLHTVFVARSAAAARGEDDSSTSDDDGEEELDDLTTQAPPALPAGGNPEVSSAVSAGESQSADAQALLQLTPASAAPETDPRVAGEPQPPPTVRATVEATIARTTASLAPSLVIHLQRFTPNMATLTWDKNHRHVHFPLVVDEPTLCGHSPEARDPKQEAVGVLRAAFPKVPTSIIRAVLDSSSGDMNTASLLLEEGVFLDQALLAEQQQESPEQRSVVVYDLVGVVTHRGRSMHGGHFTAYVRSNGTSPWLHCNDAIVDVVSEKEVLCSEAYMLFYQARE